MNNNNNNGINNKEHLISLLKTTNSDGFYVLSNDFEYNSIDELILDLMENIVENEIINHIINILENDMNRLESK